MRYPKFAFFTASLYLIILASCEKDPPADACLGITIAVTATISNATNIGLSDGSITATATGGDGFAYRLNGGSYQSSGTFNGLSKGTYTIDAISSKGCTGTKQFTVDETNLCATVNLAFTSTTSASDPCGTGNGSIAIIASGSAGYTYTIGTASNATGTFSNLAVGSHNFEIKDNKNCKITGTATVTAAEAGPLFKEAKAVITAKCVGCHGGSNPRGGKDWSVDCNVVAGKDRIKTRAVDESTMPTAQGGGPLPQADKDKITAWINAGGKYTD